MRLRPSPGRRRIFHVFRAHGTCLVAANVVLFLLIESKVEADVIVSECTVCYRAVAS